MYLRHINSSVELKMIEKCSNLPENTVVQAKPHRNTLEHARTYDERRFTRSYRMKRLDRFEKSFAFRVSQIAGTDSHIVDVPCGNGRFFDIFSKSRLLTMVDYSENMLQAVSERINIGPNVRLIQPDISSIPSPDSSAEVCFCMRLFHHMKDNQVRLAALKELSRISKKYVAISFYDLHCFKYYWRKILGKRLHGSYVTFNRLFQLAAAVDLHPIERFSIVGEPQCCVIFQKYTD